jgi:hypothetical protein
MRPRSVFAVATVLATGAVMSRSVVVAQTSKEWSQYSGREGPVADVVIGGCSAVIQACQGQRLGLRRRLHEVQVQVRHRCGTCGQHETTRHNGNESAHDPTTWATIPQRQPNGCNLGTQSVSTIARHQGVDAAVFEPSAVRSSECFSASGTLFETRKCTVGSRQPTRKSVAWKGLTHHVGPLPTVFAGAESRTSSSMRAGRPFFSSSPF